MNLRRPARFEWTGLFFRRCSMDDLKKRAFQVLRDFKGDNYAFGSGILDEAPGRFASQLGNSALFVGRTQSEWFMPVQEKILKSIEDAGVSVAGTARSAGPNAPQEDVYRLHSHIVHKRPDFVVVADGGSGVDAVKAAAILASLGDLEPEIDPYFGVGQVTGMCEKAGHGIMPVLAVMMAASSGAHLTKYSNVTDPIAGQKKLIVDEAIIPPRAVFDYDVTMTQPMSLTLDGGLDGIAHCLEVYFGSAPDGREKVEEICTLGIELCIKGLKGIKDDPLDKEARTLLGLGTDLGGYAIMVGGTSGAHLTSFSLVDVLSHGRACALMNPYYTVFFAPAVEEQLKKVGSIYRKYGYIDGDVANMSGRELGIAVAQGMLNFSRFLGFPTCLNEVPGITAEHVERCLAAAKNPQLDMKLRNMPVPLNADLVDTYMKPILESAWDGSFELIREMEKR